MANCKILSLNEAEDWKSYLSKLPIVQQDVYFTPEYYRLYENYSDGQAKCFIFESNGEVVVYPFLINSINKMGYDLDDEYFDIQGAYGYNGVATTNCSIDFQHKFYSCFKEYCKENKIIAEFTRFHPLVENHKFSTGWMQIEFNRKTVYIDLSNNYESIWNGFQESTKKQIKKAVKRFNLSCKILKNDIVILDTLIDIYHQTMVRVSSTPYLYFNKEYFNLLINNDNTISLVALYEEKPVAVITALVSKYYIHGHLGGSLKEFMFMSPSSFLYNEMIKYGQSLGCKYLHVGGGVTQNPDDSLLKYKTNFSKTLSDFYIGKKLINQSIYNQVTAQWQAKFPDKDQMNNNFLKYHSV